MKLDALEFPPMLPSIHLYIMTAFEAPIGASSSAELGTERGRLVFWLLTVKGALEFEWFSVS